MNEADLKLCRYLSQQIDARTDHCARDGYENSQGHVIDADREETNGDCVGWECITDIEQLRKVLCVVSDERYAAIRQLKERTHE